ncbi:MAG: EAL domain-containing protein [Lachnospiraceae bacterium]|nr:EAL domain-containing protein [Lachnospiraceae bacterium]
MKNLKAAPETNGRFFAERGRAFVNVLESFNHVPVFMAIRRGLALMIPLMIFGSLVIFVNNLPIPAYQNAMRSIFGDGWQSYGGYIFQATFGIASLGANLIVGYSFIIHDKHKIQDMNPMMGALISLACLFVLINTGEPFAAWLGTRGMFIALVSAIIATKMYLTLCRVRFLRINLLSNAANSNLNVAVSTLIPFCLTLGTFAAIRLIFNLNGISDIHGALYNTLSGLFHGTQSALLSGVLLQLLIHICWFFGINGSQAFISVEHEVMAPALARNIELAAQGLPPIEIINSQFFNSFVYFGGSGAALCLIIALYIAARRSNIRKVATAGILPALINVNEIIIFGVPVVLNFFLLIPMIIVPIVFTIITYIAMAIGIVPLTFVELDWTTPIFISGYYSTGGSIAGVLLQVFNLAVGILIYLPFVRLYDSSLNRDNKHILASLMDATTKINDLRRTILLDRTDAEGDMARALATDLKTASLGSDVLTLHYQPLVNDEGVVISVEALLRWNHPQLGYIPPPIAIILAEESGAVHELGLRIFEAAIKTLKGFLDSGLDLGISVNVTPTQFDDPLLAKKFQIIADQYGVSPKLVEIEITEQMALSGIRHIPVIQEMRNFGFLVAIDDFGMGHGSLTYLKDMELDILKIDGALVKEIETNQSCRDIITTIVNLGRSRNIEIIAEFVENENQRDILKEMGCCRYQGYLYSPALPTEKAAAYISKMAQEAAERASEKEG